MKQRIIRFSGLVLTVAGILFSLYFRAPALAETATGVQTFSFALSLIGAFFGLVLFGLGFRKEQKKVDVRTLATAAMFAALCYIGFAVLRIDIPVGTEKTAFHLGNVFCVLAALFLGGFWGGASGAVGLTIADLTSAYVTSAPKTFLLKMCIGLISGFVAHKVFHISTLDFKKLPLATTVSCIAGMGFNVIADPLVGYFYKQYIMGVPQDAAVIWAKMSAVTTLVNALIAIVVATLLYLALQPVLRKANLLPQP